METRNPGMIGFHETQGAEDTRRHYVFLQLSAFPVNPGVHPTILPDFDLSLIGCITSLINIPDLQYL